MRKVFAIIWKEVYTTYTDRTLLLIMIVTPLALSTIISLAFSQFFGAAGGDVPVRDIPVAVVNLDQGVVNDGRTINLGETFVRALVPPDGAPEPADNPLFALTNAVALTDADAARSGVDDGTYTGAIIIPPDFSQRVAITRDKRTLEPVQVEVYVSSASSIGKEIVRGIAQRIAEGIASGSITASATLTTFNQWLAGQGFAAAAVDFDAFGEALGGGVATASDMSRAPVQVAAETVTGAAVALNPLVLFGSSLSIFFLMFTALGGATELLTERRNWTLQRMIASPTARITILVGKMAGVFVNCIVQLTLLFTFLTLISSLVIGRAQFIWGTNILLIALAVGAVSLAAAGIGALVMALVKTPEQGSLVTSVVSMAMGLLGGAFFSVEAIPVLGTLSRLTVVWWGADTFRKLSLEQTDIGMNLLVLVGLGGALFIIGLFVFQRRMEG